MQVDTPYSVMCIDDNVLLIDALERRLGLETQFSTMFRVDDFARSVEAVLESRPTIVLLDIDLPGGIDAIAILKELVAQAPDSRVIVFTGHPTGDLMTLSMSVGAWGFVSKGVRSEALIDAIHRVMNGEAVIELDD